MSFNQMDDFTFKHSNQQDALYTQYTAQQIKDLFDSRGTELRTALNNLITKLNDINVTADLKTPALTLTSGTTVKDQLAFLLQQIGQTALGNIPDGSVTLAKMAQDVINKMNMPLSQIGAVIDANGNITNLNTVDKTKLVNAINELVASISTTTNDLTTYKSEATIQLAGGTANAITVTTGGSFTYTQFRKISFKAIADNTGNVTLNVDGKGAVPALKFDGSQLPAGNIKNGKVYDFYYDTASGGRFFLIAKASGNASATDVLAGKTCSTDNEDIVGTMANYSGANQQSGSVWNVGTTLYFQVSSSGYYPGGNSGIYFTEPNFVASNIISGKSLFGLTGSATPKNVASGTATSTAGFSSYALLNGTTNNFSSLTVSGLNFTPTLIYAFCFSSNMSYITIYNNFYKDTNLYSNAYVCVDSYSISGQAPSSTNYTIKGDVSPVIITSTDFTIPVNLTTAAYKWFALA